MNYLPIVIAAAGAGAIWYFRKDLANILGFKKKTPELLLPEAEQTTTTTTQTITPQQVLPAAKKLSPLGTPKEKLNFDVKLELGDQGQEVAKLQQILNRISKIYKTQSIAEDGQLGAGTQSKLNKTYGKSSISLKEAYLMLYAIWNANENKEPKKWYDKYFKYYLMQPERVNVARSNYFKNNPLL